MLDKSIPKLRVLMTKGNPIDYPKFTLPKGYNFYLYQKGFENDWAELQFILGQFESIDEAKKYFEQEYLQSPIELIKKIIFVKDLVGVTVGVASVWNGEHFGEKLQRAHWVAVHPEHQGKGIAKALVTRTLDVYNMLGYTDFIYLTSETWSYKAINIYRQFGFEPYLGEKPINWGGTKEQFDIEKIRAWKIINEQINNHIH